MTTNFRALCEQLMELVEGRRYDGSAVVAKARAALAAEPEPPADGEVAELVELLRHEANADDANDHTIWATAADMRRAADLLQRLAKPEPVGPTDEELADTFFQGCRDSSDNPGEPPFLAGARAVLARWGQP